MCFKLKMTFSLNDDEWPALVARCTQAIDLDASARAYGAFRRPRAVKCPQDLLRLALAYGPGGLSLRQAAAWAEAHGVAVLSDVALLKRLSRAAEWLAAVAGALLAGPGSHSPAERRLRLIDASALCQPGADRITWRLHVLFDPQAAGLVDFALTDARGAETLSRFCFAPGEIGIADRCYARPGALRPVLEAGADLIVRVGWNSLRLLGPEGAPFALGAALASGASEHAVWVDEHRADGACLGLRLIAAALPEAKAEEARRRLRRAARKKGRTADARSLMAAGFMMVLTSLPGAAYPPERVLALYRVRWQVELAFKRLKSLLHLDRLPAQDPHLARAWISAHLIAAVLIGTMAQETVRAFPP
jgi:Transposase DDE domain